MSDDELAELNSLLTKRIRRLEYHALKRPLFEAFAKSMSGVKKTAERLLAGPRADTKAAYEKLALSLERAEETRRSGIETHAADLALHTERTAALQELLQKVPSR